MKLHTVTQLSIDTWWTVLYTEMSTNMKQKRYGMCGLTSKTCLSWFHFISNKTRKLLVFDHVTLTDIHHSKKVAPSEVNDTCAGSTINQKNTKPYGGKNKQNQKQKIYSTNDTDRTTELERKTHSYTNHAALKEVHIEYIPFFFFKKRRSRNQLYDFKNLQYRLIYLQICARVEWGAMNGAHN